jgi:hypothetical protein
LDGIAGGSLSGLTPAAAFRKMHQPPGFSGRLDFIGAFGGAFGGLFATASGAGFFQGFFHGFAGFARALLDPADHFILLAFDVLEIVIRELGPFLFQLALGNVPVAFNFECSHIV